MSKITKSGEYEVTIKEPRFELAEKDGDSTRMALILPGHTESGEHVDAYQYFTRQIVSSGRNKGKSMWDVSSALCHDLGMSRPFNPTKITELDGVVCVFVVEMEEYNGKTSPKVKFINPRRKPALSMEEACKIWAELSGESDTKPVKSPAITSDDNLPF